jgi:hypothetical protein
MEPVGVDSSLVTRFPELAKVARDLYTIGTRYASLRFEPVIMSDRSICGMSWRCKALSNANLLRGEELLRSALLAVNDGAIIAACVLASALDETLAAVIFARRRIERAVSALDASGLQELLDRLLLGSRYFGKNPPRRPDPYSVMTMVDEAGRYLETLPTTDTENHRGEARDNYEFVSEFVHPSAVSFMAYQEISAGVRVFERASGTSGVRLAGLLHYLRMTGHMLLVEAEALSALPDLPRDWPGQHSNAGAASP